MLPHSGMCLFSSNNQICLVYANSRMTTAPLTVRTDPKRRVRISFSAQTSPVENHEDDAEPFYRYHVRCDLEGVGNVNRTTISRDEDAGQDNRHIIGTERRKKSFRKMAGSMDLLCMTQEAGFCGFEITTRTANAPLMISSVNTIPKTGSELSIAGLS